MVNPLAGQPRQPIVAAAVEFELVEPLLQQLDERQKAVALQPVLVEPVRRPVRGRDDDRAGLEQRPEQPFEDHRVGDVVDLELVEAQERRLGGEIGGDLRDGLGRTGAALAFEAGVDVEHESVEMHAPLVGDRRRGKKQIHQHRLAAPDRTPEIDAARRLRRSLAEHEPRQQPAVRRAGRLVVEQRVMETLQAGDGAKLRPIGADRAPSGALAVQRGRARAPDRKRRQRGRAERSSGIGDSRGSNKQRGPCRSRARAAPPIYSAPRRSTMGEARNGRSAMPSSGYSAGTGTAAVRRLVPRALPANSRLAIHSTATTTSTRSACPESISIP